MTQIHALPRPRRLHLSLSQVLLFTCCLLSSVLCLPAFGVEAKKVFDVPAGDAAATLKQFAQQAGQQVVYPAQDVKGVQTAPVKGRYTLKEALNVMLAGTGLVTAFDEKSSTFAVSRDPGPNAPRLARKNSDQPGEQKNEIKDGVIKLETFEVMGTKLLNMDLPRSRDDAQPYVIFDRNAISSSGAGNLEEFLKERLTMNSSALSNSQVSTFVAGGVSQINLRGMGAAQTLILIDGRRTAGPVTFASIGSLQPDLNGIPLSAIARIEVLPATASGLYGGSATGGVVNIILRRDYSGLEVKLGYENSFKSDVANRRIDLSAGVTFEQGKTNLLLSASYAHRNLLATQDRDFLARARATVLDNNPASILAVANPPLGATPNIRSVNGSPLFGPGTAAYASVPVGYLGGGGLAAFQVNAGRYNLDPAPSAQGGGGGLQGLLAETEIGAISGTLRRQFNERFQAFLEFSASYNNTFSPANGTASVSVYTLPANLPNNPFGQAIRVMLPIPQMIDGSRVKTAQQRAAGGFVVKLGGDWQAEADYTWNRSRWSQSIPGFNLTAAATTAITTGQLDVLRDPLAAGIDYTPYLPAASYTSPFRSTVLNASLRAAGPFYRLPAGPINLSMLVEDRREHIDEAFRYASTTTLYPSKSQSTRSGYLEARIPLVSERNRISGIRLLEAQVSGRFDHYTVNGATGSIDLSSGGSITRTKNSRQSADPTLGLRFQPFESLMLRASYGTGFVAPGVSQLITNLPTPSSGTAGAVILTDPRRGNEVLGAISLYGGGNPNLQPEKSTSWSAGAIFTPSFAKGLRLSADWVRVEKTNNITTLALNQAFIEREDTLPGRIIRGPAPAGDPFGVGPITALDLTLINLNRAEAEAIDVQLDYSLKAGGGILDWYAVATRVLHHKTQTAAFAPMIENVGKGSSFPSKLKANAGVTWKFTRWTLGWSARFHHAYYVADPALAANAGTIQSQGNGGRVPAQVYHDLFVRWRPQARRSRAWSLLADTEWQLAIRNVFNKAPPFDAAAATFYSAAYSPVGDPRMASYSLSFTGRF